MTKEIEFLDTISTLVWNDISKQELVEMIRDRKEALTEQLTIPLVVDSKHRLEIWDNGYKQGYEDSEIGRQKNTNLGVY